VHAKEANLINSTHLRRDTFEALQAGWSGDQKDYCFHEVLLHRTGLPPEAKFRPLPKLGYGTLTHQVLYKSLVAYIKAKPRSIAREVCQVMEACACNHLTRALFKMLKDKPIYVFDEFDNLIPISFSGLASHYNLPGDRLTFLPKQGVAK